MVPGAQTVKNLPVMQETRVQSPGWEVPLEKWMAIHSSILAWRTPWTEKPGGLQYVGSQKVGHNWATNTHPPTIKNHLANADMGSISALGRLHMLWATKPCTATTDSALELTHCNHRRLRPRAMINKRRHLNEKPTHHNQRKCSNEDPAQPNINK